MKMPQFSKINRHRRFDFTPRYYDPQKEEFDNRVKAIKASIGEDVENADTVRRENMRTQFKQNSNSMAYKSKKISSNIRMLIILSLIIYLSYIVFSNMDNVLMRFFK